MTETAWVRLTPGFWRDEAVSHVMHIDPGAVTLWLVGIGWCVEHDDPLGLVPRTALALRAVPHMTQRARLLVRAGMWAPDADGWLVRNYRRYQRGTVSEPEDRRLVDVWPLVAGLRYRRMAAKVGNPPAWKRSVTANAKRDQWDEAVTLCRRYPELRLEDLARVLDGETEPLRYLRSADAEASV